MGSGRATLRRRRKILGRAAGAAEREETAGDRSCRRADATGRLAFVEWEGGSAPRAT